MASICARVSALPATSTCNTLPLDGLMAHSLSSFSFPLRGHFRNVQPSPHDIRQLAQPPGFIIPMTQIHLSWEHLPPTVSLRVFKASRAGAANNGTELQTARSVYKLSIIHALYICSLSVSLTRMCTLSEKGFCNFHCSSPARWHMSIRNKVGTQ